MMVRRAVPRGVALCVLLAGGCSMRHKPSQVPQQTVDMEAHTLAKFQHEVEDYVTLRHKVLGKIPSLGSNANADELAAHQQAFTEAIVAYRSGAKRGDIFKPSVAAAIRRILEDAFAGPGGAALIQSIKQGNPRLEGNPQVQNPTKEVKETVVVAVNGVYNAAAPFSSVPPSLLLKLPLLPEAVRYRFVGRTLILRDADANVILDFIEDVVPDRSIPR